MFMITINPIRARVETLEQSSRARVQDTESEKGLEDEHGSSETSEQEAPSYPANTGGRRMVIWDQRQVAEFLNEPYRQEKVLDHEMDVGGGTGDDVVMSLSREASNAEGAYQQGIESLNHYTRRSLIWELKVFADDASRSSYDFPEEFGHGPNESLGPRDLDSRGRANGRLRFEEMKAERDRINNMQPHVRSTFDAKALRKQLKKAHRTSMEGTGLGLSAMCKLGFDVLLFARVCRMLPGCVRAFYPPDIPRFLVSSEKNKIENYIEDLPAIKAYAWSELQGFFNNHELSFMFEPTPSFKALAEDFFSGKEVVEDYEVSTTTGVLRLLNIGGGSQPPHTPEGASYHITTDRRNLLFPRPSQDGIIGTFLVDCCLSLDMKKIAEGGEGARYKTMRVFYSHDHKVLTSRLDKLEQDWAKREPAFWDEGKTSQFTIPPFHENGVIGWFETYTTIPFDYFTNDIKDLATARTDSLAPVPEAEEDAGVQPKKSKKKKPKKKKNQQSLEVGPVEEAATDFEAPLQSSPPEDLNVGPSEEAAAEGLEALQTSPPQSVDVSPIVEEAVGETSVEVSPEFILPSANGSNLEEPEVQAESGTDRDQELSDNEPVVESNLLWADLTVQNHSLPRLRFSSLQTPPPNRPMRSHSVPSVQHQEGHDHAHPAVVPTSEEGGQAIESTLSTYTCECCKAIRQPSPAAPVFLCPYCGPLMNVRYCSTACILADAYEHAAHCLGHSDAQSAVFFDPPNHYVYDNDGIANLQEWDVEANQELTRQKLFSMYCFLGPFPEILKAWTRKLDTRADIYPVDLYEGATKVTGDYHFFRSGVTALDEFSPAEVVATISIPFGDPMKVDFYRLLLASFVFGKRDSNLPILLYRLIRHFIFNNHHYGYVKTLVGLDTLIPEFSHQFMKEFGISFPTPEHHEAPDLQIDEEWLFIHKYLIGYEKDDPAARIHMMKKFPHLMHLGPSVGYPAGRPVGPPSPPPTQ